MTDPDGEGTVEGSAGATTVEDGGIETADAESDGPHAATAEGIDAVRTALADLRETTDRLEASVDEDVEDLRERFVALYRDLEDKADADHDHPETADRLETVAADVATAVERLDGVETRVESLEEALDRLDATVTAVESDVDAVDERVANAEERLSGAEERLSGAEERLEELTVAGEDRSEKLSRVASAVVRAQRELRVVRGKRADRERLDAILRTANRHGVRKADCGECANTVRLSLLSAPECPYCEAGFDDLDPADRFYRRSTLAVDDRPALEGDVAPSGSTDPSPDTGDGTLSEPTADDGTDRDEP
ncbi:hypothetical protein DQW50_04115 [Halorubrum sp. 48-1-W]|uniref:hypothetical protein n=1 Tax=Halorubrum sp. 48-1-W TaxID=2249761 RepID=UPI000DCE4E18|nr:hypothetical protein [Halorubrum sp. 48-1-W]RAW46424.1 hypothetical protein DQW50_04115 [Halorubrum sp. 48-1-W]